MNLLTSLKSELLKTRRSPIWLLTFFMAAIAPAFLLLVFKQVQDGHPSRVIPIMKQDAWNHYFYQGRGMISFVFLPMFIILISTLLPQIEYRNHTWKQVFAAPQSYARIFFSKFILFQFFIIIYLVAHLLLMGVSAQLSALRNPLFNFSGTHLDWALLMGNMSRTYLAVLPLSAIQFWLGMRFKSFLLPIGVGVLCCILGTINMIGYHVVDAEKFFFNFSGFIFFKDNVARVPYVLWSAVIYGLSILVAGFIDFSKIRQH